MRLDRWLVVAGLGVGVLAHADSDAEEQDSLSREVDDDGLIPDIANPFDDDFILWNPRLYYESLLQDLSQLEHDGHDSPQPQELVSNIPVGVTSGWKTSSTAKTHGHHWTWHYTVTATEPIEFELTYSDHHDHTTTAFGEYNTAQQPRATISSTRNALDVMQEAIIHDIDGEPRLGARDILAPFCGGIPADATSGQVWSTAMELHGKHYEEACTITGTDPVAWEATSTMDKEIVTLHGEIDTMQTPPVALDSFLLSGTTVTHTNVWHDWLTRHATHSATSSILGEPHLADRDTFDFHELDLNAMHAAMPTHFTSGQLFTVNQAVFTIVNTDPPAFQGLAKFGERTDTIHATILTTVKPPVVAWTAVADGKTFTTTDVIEPTETAAPLARRFYKALPARVTPGQVYTHTNVEKGATTTATIKVTATKPHTGFAITMHNGSVTRTCLAYIDKTAKPPVIVQTVTGAGLSFVQTDTWGPEKAHAYLPHATATAKASHLTHAKSHDSAATLSSATHGAASSHSSAPTLRASNGTFAHPAAHHVSTVVETRIMTTTVKAANTLTVFETMPPEPCSLTSDLLEPWTITATRKSCDAAFVLPSASPKAMLHSYSDMAPTLVAHKTLYWDDPQMMMLMEMSLEELQDEYHDLGWPLVEKFASEMQDLDEEMKEKEATAVVIHWMRRQSATDNFCPCDRRGRQFNLMRPGVTTEYIARLDSSFSRTITPPTTLTVDGKTIPFVMGHKSKCHRTQHSHHNHTTLTDDMLELGPLQTMVVVLDNVASNHSFPRREKDATPQCTKDANGRLDKKECEIEQCMRQFQRPINITTAMPAMMTDDRGHAFFDYFTHVTEIRGRPHWGTTNGAAIYYPMGYSTVIGDDGCPNKTATREAPEPTSTKKKSFPQSLLKRAAQATTAGDPECWNHKTCRNLCENEANHTSFWKSMTFKILLGVLAGLGFLFLLGVLACFLLAGLRRRHNKQKEERAGDPSMSGAVDPATGQSVDPSTAAAASALGPATAAAAGKSGSKNAGTLGRQAEEGRGRVHFDGGNAATAAGAGAAGAAAGEKAGGSEKSGGGASGGAHGGSGGGATEAKGNGHAGGTTTTSEKAEHHAPAEHVETVAAHDGTADSRRTGSEMADMGSMRGRRPVRSNDQGLI